MWMLTDEQQMIVDSADKMLAADHTFDQRKARVASGLPVDPELWRQFAELGWLGLPFAQDDGGFGAGVAELSLLARELGRHLVVEPFAETVVMASEIVSSGAAAALRAELISSIMEGRKQIAVALAEPDSRYELQRVATTARSSGDEFVLNGRKSVVTNAPGADLVIVPARTLGEVADEGGITLFCVPTSADGVTVKGYRLNDDHHAGDVTLKDVVVPNTHVLGEVGGGLDLLERAVDKATIFSCAEAVGAMEQIMDLTAEYLKTRVQFGKPISTNQALKFIMVELYYLLEESRSLVAGAVGAFAGDPAGRRAAVSAMKVKVGTAARKLGQEGVQLHGAIGMTEDYSVGHYYKRLETLRILYGDPDYHLARFGRWSQMRNAAS
jgi:alkylation response protein AidB-like acyl-CoA dehydrogenase